MTKWLPSTRFTEVFPDRSKWRDWHARGSPGEGKGVGYVAPFSARDTGCHIVGDLHHAAANEDHLSDGYARLQPGADFS